MRTLAPTVNPAGEKPKTVLVIDDMPDVGETICRICRSLGVDCEYLPDGDSLPDILRYSGIDGLIADIMMPDQDGYHIMKAVAGCDRDLPILMMTGGERFLLDAVDAMAEVYDLTRVLARPKPISKTVVEQFLLGAHLLPRSASQPTLPRKTGI